MTLQYIFGIVTAIIIVLGGMFLLGRDGTDSNFSENTILVEEDSGLAINPNENISDEGLEDVQLESGGDKDASTSTTQTLENTNASSTGDVIEKEGDVYIITYTKSGFSPKEIAIQQGETVRFINNSSRNMWVASNMHPTDNEYPEKNENDCGGSSFDACTGVKVGASWEFTFGIVGEWGYHDHLNSSRTGTIIVE